MKHFLISSKSKISHDCGFHWQSTMVSEKSREGDSKGMRWPRGLLEGRLHAYLCKRGVRACVKGEQVIDDKMY